MKRYLITGIALILCIVCTFAAGCSAKDPSSSDGQDPSASKTPLSDSTSHELTDPSGDQSGEKVELSRGKIDGNVYTNKFLGFEFTKPESWVYSTDEEVAALVNMGVEKILGDKFKETLENNPSVYDMMVVDTLTRSSINVCYENLSKSLSTNITVEQYVEALKKMLESVPSMKTTFPDTFESAKLGDTEFTKVVCTTTASGVSMEQVYYLKKVDGYMCFILVTIPSGYTVAQVEAMFNSIQNTK